jgi:photosystem II stability/assembly factor-like uncharacterized protein
MRNTDELCRGTGRPPAIRIALRYRTPQCRSGSGNFTQILRAINFVGPSVGWALGGEQILYTNDGGHSWRNQYPHWFQTQYLGPVAIHPIDQTRCWILATYASHEVRCLYTEDSGRSWKEKYRFFSDRSRILYLDLLFSDPSHGWILCGDGYEKRAHISILLTQDGGDRWDRIRLKARGAPRRIRFVDSRFGWFIESHNTSPPPQDSFRTTVYRTEDGGLSWTSAASLRGWGHELYAVDRKLLFIGGSKGWFARSVDSGETWEALDVHSHMDIMGVHFRGRTGIAVGSSDIVHSRRSTLIRVSHDAGQTWKRLESPISGALFAVHLTAWDRGVMAGTDGIYQFRLAG